MNKNAESGKIMKTTDEYEPRHKKKIAYSANEITNNNVKKS